MISTINVAWLILLVCANCKSPDDFRDRIKSDKLLRQYIMLLQSERKEVTSHIFNLGMCAEEESIIPFKRTQVKELVNE